MRNYRQHLTLLLMVLGLNVTGCAATNATFPSVDATKPQTPNVVYLFGEVGHRFVIDKATPGYEYSSDDPNVVEVRVEDGEVIAYTRNVGNATITNRDDAADFVFAVRRPDAP